MEWLYARQGIFTPGLGRIQALLEALGHPEARYPVVLIGGTNGKGSTARALAAILEEAGLKVGLYTSPHLVHFAERIAVNGKPIPEERLLDLLEAIRPQALAEEASFFEIATALALLHFAEEGVDLAVLEVGLGGRLDATNATEPLLSVVTNIGHDHLEILGPTLAHVAREKAGIFRKGVPALTAARGEGLRVLLEEAQARGVPLGVLGRDFLVEGVIPLAFGSCASSSPKNPTRTFLPGPPCGRKPAWGGIRPLPQGLLFTLRLGEEARTFHTPLLGPHQAENLALAAVGARVLGVGWEAIARGLSRVENPGRLQPYPLREGLLLLDGAHNPEGAKALAQALRAHGLLPCALVLAFSRDKDHKAMAEALRDLGPVVLTRYASPRSLDPEALLPLFPGALVEAEPLKAIGQAFRLADRVVVAGSLYLVGEVLRALRGLPPEERWQ